MAIVQRMKSDLTGQEDDPEKFGQFIIRKGPGIDRAIVWDVLPEEVGNIEAAPDIFIIEYRPPNVGSMVQNGEEMVVSLKEITDKVVPKGQKFDDLVEAARALRGRPPGSRNR